MLDVERTISFKISIRIAIIELKAQLNLYIDDLRQSVTISHTNWATDPQGPPQTPSLVLGKNC